jgi:hypothetical protein
MGFVFQTFCWLALDAVEQQLISSENLPCRAKRKAHHGCVQCLSGRIFTRGIIASDGSNSFASTMRYVLIVGQDVPALL